MTHYSDPVNRIRNIVHAFSLAVGEQASRLLATAAAQQRRGGGIDMETDIALTDIGNSLERDAKADLNLHAIESAVYRHREEVSEWLRDPCYDLEGQAKSESDIPHLRAFAHIAMEAGSPNVANAIYVLRLEKRVATLEHRAAMADAMTQDDADVSRPVPRLGG